MLKFGISTYETQTWDTDTGQDYSYTSAYPTLMQLPSQHPHARPETVRPYDDWYGAIPPGWHPPPRPKCTLTFRMARQSE